MIRIRWTCIVLALLTAAMLVLGLNNKKTYTDKYHEPDFLDTVYVAELSEEMTLTNAEEMEKELPNSPMIFCVKEAEDIALFHGRIQQKASVSRVLKGEGLSEGDTILLSSNSWTYTVDETYTSLEREFVNILRNDTEYLIFGNRLEDNIWNTSDPVYLVEDEYLIAPVFALKDIPNTISENFLSPDTSYVPYSEVKDNEFFCRSQKGLDALVSLKKTLFEKYNLN